MKNKLIISFMYIAVAAITTFLVLVVWVYLSLSTEKGFSSDYIRKIVIEEFNANSKDINIDLKDIRLRLLDDNLTLGLRAKKLIVYQKDKPVAQMDDVEMSLAILDIISGDFPVSSLYVDGGRIIYHNTRNIPVKISPKVIIGGLVFGSIKIFENMYELEKVTLSNFSLQYFDDSGTLMVYRDVNVGIVKNDKILDIDLLGDLNLKLPNKQVIKTGVIFLKSKFDMTNKNILNYKLDLKGIDNPFDISLTSKYYTNDKIVDVNFDLLMQDFSTLGTIGLQNSNILGFSSADLSVRTKRYHLKKGGNIVFDGKIDQRIVNGEVNVGYKKVKFDLYGENIDEEILKKYWAKQYAPEIREWMLQNIIGSYDLNIRFDSDLKIKQISGVEGTVVLKDAVVDYYNGLPALKVKKAVGQFTEDKIDIAVQRASFRSGDENIDVSNSTVKIFNKGDNTLIGIDMGLSAKWQNVLSYLKRPQISFKPFIADLNQAKANTAGELKMLFNITAGELDTYSYKGKLSNVSASEFNKFTNVKAKVIKLILDEKSIDVSGKIKFNTKSFGDIKYKYLYANEISDLTYNGVIDVAAVYTYVDKTIIEIATPVVAQVKYKNKNLNQSHIVVKSDLTQNSISILPLQWKKGIAEPAFLHFDMTEDGNKNYNMNVAFKSATIVPVDAKILIAGDKDGIKKIVGKALKYNKGELTINAMRNNGYLTGQITGKDFYVDRIRYALENIPQRATSRQKYDFNVKLNNLKSFDGHVVSKLSATLKHNGKSYDKIIARMDTSNPKVSAYVRYDTKKLRFYTNNLGVIYNILFGGQPIKDGRVGMSGDLNKSGYISGKLVVNDIEVLDVPESTRILKLFSVFGVFDALQSKNLFFNKIKGNFTLKDGVYETDNISSLGRTIALSTKGYIDTNDNTLELRGMVLPSYKLGAIFNHIPILGALVSGTDGQGPITQKYVAKGGFSDYEVEVDSTGFFTVGILRDIFSILVPDENDDIKVDFEDDNISN